MHKNKSNIKEFILKATKVHGDRYCYLNSIYNGARFKINIECRKHGSFNQLASNHLKGSGCPKCRDDSNSAKSSIGLDIIKKKIHSTHGSRYKYNFDGVSRIKDKVEIICEKHRLFKQIVQIHINGGHCRKCSYEISAKKRSSSKFDFIEKANKVHSNKYDYSLVKYSNSVNKVDIVCKIHGVFKQKPYAHLTGNGCLKCHIENKESKSFGFNREAFIKSSNKSNGLATLYIVKLNNDNEEFYKVGITTKSTEKRMSKIGSYKKQVIKEFYGEAGFIHDLERWVNDNYKHLKYAPLLKFDGYTECFNSIPKDLYNTLDKHIMDKQINVGH